MTISKREAWARDIAVECLKASNGDEEAALLAVEIFLSTQPLPDETQIDPPDDQQEPWEEEGGGPPGHQDGVPVDLNAFFSFDIHNKKAQGILNRSLQAVKGLSASAREDFIAALKKGATGNGEAILHFVDKYRVKLAKVLTNTQLAALLEGAQDVANKVPPLGTVPVEGLPVLEQEKILQAGKNKPPPPKVPKVGGGAPEDIHYVTIDQAVKNLADRNVIDKQSYEQLDAAARAKAFTVANVQAEETLTKIKDSLADNVKEGVDYETWSKKMLEDVEQGTFMSDAHQETVFRTNVQTAFSDGQAAVLAHPLVRSGFPYSAYDAIHDARVRKEHLAMDKHGIGGTNIYRNDDPVFQLFRPPWDYNCRCSWTPLTVRNAAEHGIKEAQEWLDTGVEPAVKSFVKMPNFEPPEGFQRAVSSAPLSIQLSLQSTMTFSNDKKDEEPETAELFGQPEVGSIGSATLDTAKEGGRAKGKMKVGKAKTAKGKAIRRSLFKRLRIKRRWRPAVALSTEAPVGGPSRLQLIAEILVLMFGKRSIAAAKRLKAGGIAMSLDSKGIWHGPTPPNTTHWVQIADGPKGGKRWQYIGDPSDFQHATKDLPKKQSHVAAHQNRKAKADAAHNLAMAELKQGKELPEALKMQLFPNLSVMTKGQLDSLHKALGGTEKIVGTQRQPWVHAIKAILTGTSALNIPIPLPPESVKKKSHPDKLPEYKKVEYVTHDEDGNEIPAEPPEDFDLDDNIEAVVAEEGKDYDVVPEPTKPKTVMENLLATHVVSVYKHPSTGEEKLAISIEKDSPEGQALTAMGAGWSNSHKNFTISAAKASEVLKILAPWPSDAEVDNLKVVQKLGGSTGAELVEHNGKKYVRKYGASPEHVASEWVTDEAYLAAGMAVPKAKLFKTAKGTVKLAEFIEGGQTLSNYAGSGASSAHYKKAVSELRKGFVMDALLGNWDVIGANNDNILVDKNGKVWRIDNGGSLAFRAQGAKKTTDQWNAKVADIDSMRTASINPTAAAIFGGITDDEIRDQVSDMLGKKDKILTALPKDQRGLVSQRMDTLAKRFPPSIKFKSGEKTFVTAAQTGTTSGVAAAGHASYTPSAPDKSHVAFKVYKEGEKRSGFDKGEAPASLVAHVKKAKAATPSEYIQAVKDYTNGGYTTLNETIQKCPQTLDCLSASQKKQVAGIDKAIQHQGVMTQPMTVWRRISVADKAAYASVFMGAKAVGATIQMPGIKSCSTRWGAWHGNTIFEIVAKTGIYSAPFSNHSSEDEFTQGTHTKYKVLGIEKINGNDVIRLEEVL